MLKMLKIPKEKIFTLFHITIYFKSLVRYLRPTLYSRVLNVFGMAVLLILISVVKSMLNFYKYHKTPFKKRIMTTALALLFLHINRTLKVSNWVTQEKTWC